MCKSMQKVSFFMLKFLLFLIYSHEAIMPFIPIGLKETIDINFMETFSERVSHFLLFSYGRASVNSPIDFRTTFSRNTS